ncbi:MAG: protein kinase, partial [Myxococcota bacterium]
MHPPQPGDVLLDRYTLIRRLGSGLGGETWAAHGPDRAVAVKMIRNQNERAITDLLREASLLRRLRHPHVVIYREFADRPDEGVTYLVTDLARGGDLETYIHTHGPRSPGQIAQLGQQLISALRVLHQHGVLHRD